MFAEFSGFLRGTVVAYLEALPWDLFIRIAKKLEKFLSSRRAQVEHPVISEYMTRHP
jgi:hypothetical protein